MSRILLSGKKIAPQERRAPSPPASGAPLLNACRKYREFGEARAMEPVILVRDWRETAGALQAARASGTAPTLVTPEGAASFYGAGYLGALQERAHREFPDVPFRLIVDCGDAPGHALACLRAGVKLISMTTPNEKIADIARRMGAELVRRPT